jgi:hypothetical protein
MPSPLAFKELQALFDSLGVKDFGAALPEGRIHWTDAGGKVVAHARCRAILSWASTNHSIMWAEAIASFQQAGVPCLPAPEGEDPYVQDIDEDLAQELAGQSAQLVNAQFLYAAPTGGGGKLFLAVTDFTPGAMDEDPGQEARRIEAARGWAAERLVRLAALLEQGEVDEVATLLGSLSGQARQQADFVVRGTDLAPRLSGLATQAMLWAQALPEHKDRVAYELKVAARGWQPA